MCAFGVVQDESGCSVLYGLEFSEVLGGDSGVEGIVVVEVACDKCLSDSFSGVD